VEHGCVAVLITTPRGQVRYVACEDVLSGHDGVREQAKDDH
jgi:hypothetical protein